jgi:tRNA threonylcarbamoyladenosine biosynthesis protein TsaE
LVVSLLGELGASKTTFTKHFAREVGINDTVQSPTFVIEKIYDLKDTKLYPIFHDFIHIDAYRIEKDEEMLGLGWEKIVSNPKNIIFVEWGEKIQNILGEHTKINFYHGEDESQRYIEF